jgi:hypothetical protein
MISDLGRVLIWTFLFILFWGIFLSFCRLKDYLHRKIGHVDPLQPPEYTETRFSLRKMK